MKQATAFLFGVGVLLGAHRAAATGVACVDIGYRPAFSCGAVCGVQTPSPFLVGRELHVFGHDFDRYVAPVAVLELPNGDKHEVGGVAVLSPEEVAIDLPHGIWEGRVSLKDSLPIHDIETQCISFEAPYIWYIAPGESCAHGTAICMGSRGSTMQTPDLAAFSFPVPAPTNLAVDITLSNAVVLSWTFDSRDAAELEFELEGPDGLEALGPLPSAQGSEPIFGLRPGERYGFRIRAVASSGRRSAWSTTVWADLPSVQVRYLDSSAVLHPFYSERVDRFLEAKVTGIWAMYDSNSDGIHPEHAGVADLNNQSALYPWYYDGNDGFVKAGARYNSGANVVVVVLFETHRGSQYYEFASAHLQITPQSWGGVMTAGVPDAGIVMGSYQPIQEGDIEVNLPTYDRPYGAIWGAFSNEVFLSTTNGNLYGTVIEVSFPLGIAIVDERTVVQ